MEAHELLDSAIKRAKFAKHTPSVVQFVTASKKPVETPQQAIKPEIMAAFRKWVTEIEGRLDKVIHRVEEIELLQRPAEPTPDGAPPPEPILKRPRIMDIKMVVCSHFGFSAAELEGPGRKYELVQARHIAQHLCRRLTLQSMPAIGLHFGNRDHTSILHADRVIREHREKDSAFDAELRLLESKVIERMR